MSVGFGIWILTKTYVDKVLRLFDNRSTVLKDTISIDNFSEDQHTEQLLRDFIIKILDEKLQPKKGNTQETAIRELCDDWFEIKYIPVEAEIIKLLKMRRRIVRRPLLMLP